jgi:hypothetical protein
MELFLLIHAHRAQGGAYGSPSGSEDRSYHEHLGMLPDAPLENSGASGSKARIIVAGRIRTRSPLFWQIAVTSVPYPFLPQMAKVELVVDFSEVRA